MPTRHPTASGSATSSPTIDTRPRRRAADPVWTVTVDTSFELLALLYRAVQAAHGVPARPPTPALAVPTRLRRAADWFFRGDIALGMNLMTMLHERGWRTISDLVSGVGATDPDELVQTMLQSPEATRQEEAQRHRRVATALARRAADPSLLEALERELFDTGAVVDLLRDPRHAVETLRRLLRGYGEVVKPHERTIHEELAGSMQKAETQLARLPLVEAAEQLCPHWRRTDLARFREVVFVPSRALAPFVSARVTRYDRALIAYPGQDERELSDADLVDALKAVADPQRIEILRRATAAPVTGHELASVLGLTPATVHHHTSLLRAVGLLVSVRTGNRVYHSSRPERVEQVFRTVTERVLLTTSASRQGRLTSPPRCR